MYICACVQWQIYGRVAFISIDTPFLKCSWSLIGGWSKPYLRIFWIAWFWLCHTWQALRMHKLNFYLTLRLAKNLHPCTHCAAFNQCRSTLAAHSWMCLLQHHSAAFKYGESERWLKLCSVDLDLPLVFVCLLSFSTPELKAYSSRVPVVCMPCILQLQSCISCCHNDEIANYTTLYQKQLY